MDVAQIETFSHLLDTYPAGFSGNPLNLLFVEDASPIVEAERYLQHVDDVTLLEEQREYLLDSSISWPFPRIHVHERPDPWAVSAKLFERFDDAQRFLMRQMDIDSLIEERVRRKRPDVVALVIVDGLSYYDLPDTVAAEPCLVQGVSITQYGFRAVTGSALPVSRRLFALGYKDQMGFSYYAPETNELAEDLFDTFSSSQVVRVRAFDEVLSYLKSVSFRRGYVQITLSGLDHLSHKHPDRPPRERYLADILRRFDDLVEVLSTKAERVVAVLTADHGILWRDAVEDKVIIPDDLFLEDMYHPRYVKGAILRPYGRTCKSLGHHYTLLSVPWMTRQFRNNEWGVHGGISAWESIVPLIIREC
jgi:hypothetical protein